MDSTVRRLVADLDWLVLRRMIFKSDQEPAILALKQPVRESMPTVEFVMEESPVEEHQLNGTIEVTVREIQKQVREMKSALEERMKCEVPSRHPILAFLVEHAGRLMSRCTVDSRADHSHDESGSYPDPGTQWIEEQSPSHSLADPRTNDSARMLNTRVFPRSSLGGEGEQDNLQNMFLNSSTPACTNGSK